MVLRLDPPRKSPSIAEFERVYTAEFGLVWRTLRRFGVPSEQLEDAAQDVFVVWVRRGEELGRGASARTCLYGIARRVAADARRSTARVQRRYEALAAVGEEVAAGLEERLEEQRAASVIERALAELPAPQREVLLLAAVEGMSAREIGEVLQISANTASSRLRLARQRLAAALPVTAAEPPAAARSRVWAALIPLWPGHLDVAPRGALSAKALLWSCALGVALAVGALTPASIASSAGSSAAAPEGSPGAPELAGAVADADDDRGGGVCEAPAGSIVARQAAVALDLSFEADPQDRPGSAPTTATTATTSRAARRRSGSSGREPQRAAAEDPLAREVRQIRAAQRLLLAGEPSAAISAIESHAAEAPHGLLADEREALRAAALCEAGEVEAGLAAAERWFAGREGTPALARARARCRASARREALRAGE
ncbi:MAG: sigma-70 family RNA polymerase sigma factor [Nannocystis sp.]|nr:sigma-70 family RNA polymerase sigma factor [Nannocystis sp.]